MLQGIWDSVKSFFKNPIKAVFDPWSTIEYQTEEMAKKGMTPVEISGTLEANGFVKGSTFNDIWVTGKAIGNFTAKNLPMIIILAVVFVSLYYVLQFRKLAA